MREGAHSGVLSLAKQVSAGPREAWQHGRVHVDTVGSVEGTMLAVSALFSYAVCVCVFGVLESLFSQVSLLIIVSPPQSSGLPSPPAWVNLLPPR